MKMETDGPQEIQRAVKVARFPQRQHGAEGAILGQQLLDVADIEDISRDPAQEMKVAQGAAPFLDVRLDQERTVAVTPMPGRPFGLLDADEIRRTQFVALGAEALTELDEEGLFPRKAARVEQSGADGGVATRFRQAFLDRPCRMADLETEIPEEIEHEFDRGQGRVGGIGLGQEQQINIAEGGKVAAPKTARRDHGHAVRRIRPSHDAGIVHEGNDHAVHMPGEGRGRGQTGKLVALESVLQLVLHTGEMPAEHRQGRLARQASVLRRDLRQRVGQRRGQG